MDINAYCFQTAETTLTAELGFDLVVEHGDIIACCFSHQTGCLICAFPGQIPDVQAAHTRLIPAVMHAPLTDVADEVRAHVALHLRGAAAPYPPCR